MDRAHREANESYYVLKQIATDCVYIRTVTHSWVAVFVSGINGKTIENISPYTKKSFSQIVQFS